MNEQRTPAELLALRFHETYERLAPQFGYETRPDTKAFDPTTPNGRLMIAVCGEIAASPEPQAPIGHSEQWWLHRLDMEKTAAWQQGYAQGIYRATHPSREAEPTPDKRLAAAEPVGIVLKRLRTVGGIQETIVGPELFEAFKDLPANTYLYAEPPDWEAKLRSFWQSWSVSKEQAEPLTDERILQFLAPWLVTPPDKQDALAALAKFRKAARVSAVRAALAVQQQAEEPNP